MTPERRNSDWRLPINETLMVTSESPGIPNQRAIVVSGVGMHSPFAVS